MRRQKASGVSVFTITVVMMVMFASIALGATISVPTDVATIQDAINAWTDGDVIFIEPGTYDEDFAFGGTFAGNSRGITFETDPANPAVLNGEITINHNGAHGNGNITFENIVMGDDAQVVIPSGLIITGGTMPGGDTDWFGLSIGGHNLKVVGGPHLTSVGRSTDPDHLTASVLRFSSEGGGELYFADGTWAGAQNEAIALDLDVKDGATLTHEGALRAVAAAAGGTAIALDVTGVEAGSEFEADLHTVRATTSADGSEAIGINYDVAGGNVTQLAMGRSVQATAEGADSQATGIRYNTSAGGEVYIGNMPDGGLRATAAGDGSTAVGASYENTGANDLQVTLETEVRATGGDQATGIRFESSHNQAAGTLNLDGDVRAHGGNEATGIDFSVAGDGTLAAADANIIVTATEDGSSAVGVTARKLSDQRGNLDVAVGDVTVTGGQDVTGIDFASVRGGIVEAGNITVTGRDADSAARGVVTESTDHFSTNNVTVGDVTVTGGALAEGISHSAQRGGTIKSGDIDVEATEAGSAATGISVNFEDVADYEAIAVNLQDNAITVAGGAQAAGINFNSNYGGLITGVSSVDVTARDTDGYATGVIASSSHDTAKLRVSLGDVTVASGEETGGVLDGDFAGGVEYTSEAGGSLTIAGPVNVRSGNFAGGISVQSGDDVTIDIQDDVTVRATADDSDAIGSFGWIDGELAAAFRNIDVEGARFANGIQYGAAAGGTMATGDITVTQRDDDGSTVGLGFGFMGDFDVDVGQVHVTSEGAYTGTVGASYETLGGSLTHVSQGIDVQAAGDAAEAIGFVLWADDDTTVDTTGAMHVVATGADAVATGAEYMGVVGAELDVTHTGHITVGATGEATGILFEADRGSLNYTGELDVSADGAATGVSASAGGELTVAIQDIVVEGGEAAIGLAATAGDGGVLTVGDITSTTREDYATAEGAYTAAAGNLEATFQNVSVTARGIGSDVYGVGYETSGGTVDHTADSVTVVAEGEHSYAMGMDVYVGDDTTFTASGDITVEALGNESDAFGTWYEGTPGAELNVIHTGDVTVSASSEARGIEMDADEGSLMYTGQLAVTGGDAATGVNYYALNNGSLTMSGPVDVQAGNEARGIVFEAGNDGVIDMQGDVTVTATADGSEAMGVDGWADGELTAVLQHIDVEGGRYATGAQLVAFDGGHITAGDITVSQQDDDGTAIGFGAGFGGDLNVDLGQVHVMSEGADTGTVGVAYETLGGSLTHVSEDIDVTATGDGAEALGFALFTGDDATVDVNGALKVSATGAAAVATGAEYGSGAGAQLDVTHTGDITVDASEQAAGIVLQADSGSLTYTGELDVTAGEAASGINFDVAGDGDVTVAGSVDVQAGNEASGIKFEAGGDGTIDVQDNVAVTATTDGSWAAGATVAADGELTAALQDIVVEGGESAIGLAAAAGDGGNISVGDITSTTRDEYGTAVGAFTTTTGHLEATFQNVSVTSQGDNSEVYGVGYESLGGSVDHVADRLAVVTEGEQSYAMGMALYATDDTTFTATGDITVEALGDGSEAIGTWYESDAGAQLDVTHTGDITVGASAHAAGIMFASDSAGIIDMRDNITVTATADGSEAIGAHVSAGGELTANFQNITVEAGDKALGITLMADEMNIALDADQTIDVLGRDDDATVWGAAIAGDEISLTNAGTIHAQADGTGASATGLAVEAATSATIDNSGTIRAALSGDSVGIAIDASGSTGDIQLNHTGDIVGHVVMGAGDDSVVINEQATLMGSVLMGDGDDSVTLEYGAELAGKLDGGTGNNTLALGEGASTDVSEFDWQNVESAWHVVLAENFGSGSIDGGAWAFADGTELGDIAATGAHLFVGNDGITIDNLNLNDNSTLAGHGTIVGNMANNGSVISPGSAAGYGIVTVTGDYTQHADGRLDINIRARNDHTTNPATAGVEYDQLVVDGTATFADGTTIYVKPVFDPLRPHRAQYDIVSGNTVFDPNNVNFVYDADERLFYEGKLENGSMRLVLQTVPFETVAGNALEQAVGEALTEAREHPPHPDLDDLYVWLYTLEPGDEDEARAAFGQAGDIDVMVYAPALSGRRLAVLGDAFSGHTYAQDDKRAITVRGYSDTSHVGDVAIDVGGAALGIELGQMGPLHVGAEIGTMGTKAVVQGAGDRSIQGNGYMARLVGRADTQLGSFGLAMGHSRLANSVRRSSQLGPVTHIAEGEFDSSDFVVAASARFAPKVGGKYEIQPVASLAWSHVVHEAFTETGAMLNMDYDRYSATGLRGNMGFTVSMAADESRVVEPSLTVVLVRDFIVPDRTLQARIAGGATPVTFDGFKESRDALVVDFGIQAALDRGFVLGLDYKAELRGNMSSQTLQGRIGLNF